MRFPIAAAILFLCATTAFAQNSMSDSLRKGILAEDSEQKLPVAIQQYQAVLNQYSEERLMAATALFRMGECYRKMGKRPQAIGAYQRVLKDFPDQTKLVQQSRVILATIYNVMVDATPAQTPGNAKAQADSAKIVEARAQYRATLIAEEDLVQHQLTLVRQRQNAGLESALSSGELEQKIQQLKREVAAFDAGFVKAR